MNCAQFDPVAGDIAAGRRELAGPAWVHAARCGACQERLFAERNLHGALTALRRELAAVHPPAELEERLVRRLAARGAIVAPPAVPPGAAPLHRNRVALGAIAASVVLAFVLVVDGSRRLHGTGAAGPVAAALPSPRAAYGAGHPRGDAKGVVRVHMPRAAAAVFGLPFDPRRAQETVAAELLVDNAGTVTAVRIVR